MDTNREFSIQDFQQDEYERQLFDCSARAIWEGVKDNIVLPVIENIAESLKKTLIKTYPSEDSANKIISATDELINQSQSSSVEPLNQLKKVLNDSFNIPANVLLPEDKVQCLQYSKSEEERVDQEIADLTARAQRARFLEAILEDEICCAFKIEDLHTIVKSAAENENKSKHWNENVSNKLLKLHKEVSVQRKEVMRVLDEYSSSDA